MKRRSTLVASSAVAIALFAAGCGGDEEEPTTSSTTTPAGATGASGEGGPVSGGVLPTDFVAEADSICAEESAELDAAFADLAHNPSPADIEDAVPNEIVPNIQGQLDAIGELDPPAEGGVEFDAFLTDAQTVLDQLESNPQSLAERNPFDDVNEQALALGLEECSF